MAQLLREYQVCESRQLGDRREPLLVLPYSLRFANPGKPLAETLQELTANLAEPPWENFFRSTHA